MSSRGRQPDPVHPGRSEDEAQSDVDEGSLDTVSDEDFPDSDEDFPDSEVDDDDDEVPHALDVYRAACAPSTFGASRRMREAPKVGGPYIEVYADLGGTPFEIRS